MTFLLIIFRGVYYYIMQDTIAAGEKNQNVDLVLNNWGKRPETIQCIFLSFKL